MSREKQIEEMHLEFEKWDDSDTELDLGEWMLNAGYRKATDVAAEIFAEIERLLDTYSASYHYVGEVYGESYFERGLEDAIAELKKKHTESEGVENAE